MKRTTTLVAHSLQSFEIIATSAAMLNPSLAEADYRVTSFKYLGEDKKWFFSLYSNLIILWNG